MQPVRAGPSPPKKGSGTSAPGLSKKTPTRVLVKVSPTPISSPYSLQQLVGRADALVLDDAEHPLGGLVVGRELGLPVAQLGPLGVLEEGRAGPVERVGVAEAAAADAAAGDDEDVLEEGQPQNPRMPSFGAQK